MHRHIKFQKRRWRATSKPDVILPSRNSRPARTVPRSTVARLAPGSRQITISAAPGGRTTARRAAVRGLRRARACRAGVRAVRLVSGAACAIDGCNHAKRRSLYHLRERRESGDGLRCPYRRPSRARVRERRIRWLHDRRSCAESLSGLAVSQPRVDRSFTAEPSAPSAGVSPC